MGERKPSEQKPSSLWDIPGQVITGPARLGEYLAAEHPERENAATSVPYGPPKAPGETETFNAPQGDAPAPYHPGVDGDTSTTESIYGDTIKGQESSDIAFPKMQQRARGPGDVVQGEGENFLPTRGQKLFDETYVRGPKRLASAQEDVGRLSANKSEALAEKYGQQRQQAEEAMAANQVRRRADDQEINIRQQQLERATSAYTNDLRDQNKFWSSPGNIVSAIAFSLMPIFSNDPTIGIKLINQAIDRDMTNRKDLANMHLGELRSNVGMYRKMADDRNVGDQIAQAEAHRVAAMDIERISQQFDSPISKAKAQAMMEDQLMRAGQVQMTAYNHFNYNTVRKLDPRVAKAYELPGKQGNQDAWHSFTIPAGAAGNAIGRIGGTASTARDTNGGSGGAGGILNQMSPQQVVSLAYSPDQIMRLADSGQLKGKELAVMTRNAVVARAKSITNENSPNYELEFNKNVDELQTGAEAAADHIAKLAAPHVKGMTITRRIAGDMATIEAELQGTGISPNEFLGELRSGTGGPLASKIQNLRIKLNNDNTDNKFQKQEMDFLKASERFHQLLAQNVISFTHENAGTAVNPMEAGNIKQVISTEDNWDKIKGFVNTQSQQYAAEYKNALSTGGDKKGGVYGRMLYLANNGDALSTLDRQGTPGVTKRDPVLIQRERDPQSVGARPQVGTPTPLANPGRYQAGPSRPEDFAP